MTKRWFSAVKIITPKSTLGTGESDENDSRWRKRKVALVLGYIGTNYYGLQYQSIGFPTIESVLEDCLYRLGCISELNHKQFTKLGWSRSSRTDKGVHCARVIIGTKLLLDMNWVNNSNYDQLVDMVNTNLPDDIRLFSITKVHNKFDARDCCNWREYDYLLPVSALTSEAPSNMFKGTSSVTIDNKFAHSWSPMPTTAKEAVQRLNDVLKILEGAHSYHNFHKIQGKKLRQKGPSKDFQTQVDVEVGLQGTGSDNTDSDVEVDFDKVDLNRPNDVEVEDDGEVQNSYEHMYHFWDRLPRRISVGTRCNIYRLHASLISHSNDSDKCDNSESEPIIRIRILGQAFLLNQIRLMVGAAVSVVRGVQPIESIKLAMEAPLFVPCPLAPAQGLLLVNAGLHQNDNRDFLSVCPTEICKSTSSSTSTNRDKIDSTSQEINIADNNNKKEKNYMVDDSYCLLKSNAYASSQRFLVDRIYSRIRQDWVTVPVQDSEIERAGVYENKLDTLLQKWLRDNERYRVPLEVGREMQREGQQWSDRHREEEMQNRQKEIRRVDKEVRNFRAHDLQMLNDAKMQRRPSVSTSSTSGSRDGKKGEQKGRGDHYTTPVQHKRLLPNGLATALIIEIDEYPGPIISEALRGLATCMIYGTLQPDSTIEDILNFVRSKGGIRSFIDSCVMHPFID